MLSAGRLVRNAQHAVALRYECLVGEAHPAADLEARLGETVVDALCEFAVGHHTGEDFIGRLPNAS